MHITILNININETTVVEIKEKFKNCQKTYNY